MADRSTLPVISEIKGQVRRQSDVPRAISKETADRLFIVMMRDQARFGVGRGLLGSRMSVMLTNLRDALRKKRMIRIP
jgi:hypothetical protein